MAIAGGQPLWTMSQWEGDAALPQRPGTLHSRIKEASPDVPSVMAFPKHTLQLGSASREETHSVMPRESLPRLGALDTTTLEPNQTLWYFGVLAIQALLLPRFHYATRKAKRNNNKCGVKLTMYGQTIVRDHVFNSQMEAKAVACSVALKSLKSQFPEWRVPGVPTEDVITAGWNWIELLHDYCVQNGLPAPKYTPYDHENGRRYEVELQGASYFGASKYYADEFVSRNASAHMALHALLVFGNGVHHGFPGPFILRRSDENMLRLVPRIPEGAGGRNIPSTNQISQILASATSALSRNLGRDGQSTSQILQQPRAMRNQDLFSSNSRFVNDSIPKRPAEDERTGRLIPSTPKRARTRGRPNNTPQSQKKAMNANLLPLTNSRVKAIEIPDKIEEKRWKLTPREIEKRLESLQAHSEKLERMCDLLSLERPEIRIESNEGRLIETDKGYTAAAYFQNDPFLARAGAIGEVKGVRDKAAAKEGCANAAIKFLLNIVREDLALEGEAVNEQGKK
ncbi:hypothetical protein ASPWEDRAFT_184854 [Aspergillus wentii DTO 134E9]|uniref:DRBM domain-containing protein n=1 Tax=Aspergillus wentii DTO 134E9 TaxID=1073089 RepID=A0A1L9RHE4_ASPWE|nr:uncharacterized protein ASPWEDRAFT_184854 [Aspergillus wentii DTO 134E9]OJJ34351.1 hypothetical protein ASPWEDRAFT_184854 [Aspergillus wentii DTO 134E9]